MKDLLPQLGYGSSVALLVGGAFLLAKFTSPSIAIAAFSAAHALLQKYRDNSGFGDAAVSASPGVALGAGSFFVG